uniref:GST N-terminal domain-containing protein n=1 Tax=Arcella intermedia TaxID=1963864 RepID=A0A6B2L7T1_9EUKA
MYGSAPSRAARPIWLLHEMQAIDSVVIRPVNMQHGEHKSPEFLKINPLGVVPALVDGDFCLGESIAIMHYLLKRLYQEGRFVPFDLAQRAIYDTCLCLAGSDLDNAVLRVFGMKFFTPPEQHNQSLFDYYKYSFDTQSIPVLTKFLTDSEFLCGQQFTTADIAVGYTLHAANALGWLKEHEVVYNYYLRLAHRPAFQAALLSEVQIEALPPAPPSPVTKPKVSNLSTRPVLYTHPATRGQRVIWTLHEAGIYDKVDIKTIDLTKGEHKSPEYLKIHPGGVLPCLVDGDFVVTESGAIIMHLLRKFNKWGELGQFDLKGNALWERALFLTLGWHFIREPEVWISCWIRRESCILEIKLGIYCSRP